MLEKLVIVQARMGSNRLPGKSLAFIGDKPLLGHTIRALQSRPEMPPLVIATSRDTTSDSLVDYCQSLKLNLFRGDENNVASRYFEILKNRPSDYFCRISGDSPFIDPETILHAFEMAETEGGDIISTTGTRFPSGMNAEVIRTKTFLSCYPKFHGQEHFEHVTKYFYENAAHFDIRYLPCPIENGRRFKFTVDDSLDHERMNALFKKMTKEPFQYSLEEKCSLFEELFLEMK